MYTVISHPV